MIIITKRIVSVVLCVRECTYIARRVIIRAKRLCSRTDIMGRYKYYVQGASNEIFWNGYKKKKNTIYFSKLYYYHHKYTQRILKKLIPHISFPKNNIRLRDTSDGIWSIFYPLLPINCFRRVILMNFNLQLTPK